MIPNQAAPFGLEVLEQVELPSKTWYVDSARHVLRKTIDELDAVLQAAYLAIQTARYSHLIFSWQYGSELRNLLGKDEAFVFSEAKRMIADALSTDSRIIAVKDFAMNDGAITFTIDTIFGSQILTTEMIK